MLFPPAAIAFLPYLEIGVSRKPPPKKPSELRGSVVGVIFYHQIYSVMWTVSLTKILKINDRPINSKHLYILFFVYVLIMLLSKFWAHHFYCRSTHPTQTTNYPLFLLFTLDLQTIPPTHSNSFDGVIPFFVCHLVNLIITSTFPNFFFSVFFFSPTIHTWLILSIHIWLILIFSLSFSSLSHR